MRFRLILDFVNAYLMLGETNLKLQDARGALSAYSKVAELDPENTEAQLKLSAFYMLGKEIEESRRIIDAILAQDPDNIEALLLYAGVLIEEKNLSEAASVFKQILELDNNEIRAYLGLSRAMYARGQVTEAEKILIQAVDIDPKTSTPHLELHRLYLNQKRFAEAEEQIVKALSANPTNADLHIFLGNFYFRQKSLAKAEAAYRKAVNAEPESIKPYMALSGFYSATGRQKKSLTMLEKAQSLQPNNLSITNAIAEHYLKNKNFEAVEKHVTEILQKNPDYFPTRLLQAELLVARKKFAAAIDLLNQLVTEEPNSFRAHYVRGRAHLGNGESNIAKMALIDALEINPKHVRSRILLAGIYMRKRDFALAQDEASKNPQFSTGQFSSPFDTGQCVQVPE